MNYWSYVWYGRRQTSKTLLLVVWVPQKINYDRSFGPDPGKARITVEEEHAIQMNLFALDSIQEIYSPCNSQETGPQMYTHNFSLEVKMVEILMDFNWRWGSENIRLLQKVRIPCSSSTVCFRDECATLFITEKTSHRALFRSVWTAL